MNRTSGWGRWSRAARRETLALPVPRTGRGYRSLMAVPLTAALILSLNELPENAPGGIGAGAAGDIHRMVEQAQREGDVPLPGPSDVEGVWVSPVPPGGRPDLQVPAAALAAAPRVE